MKLSRRLPASSMANIGFCLRGEGKGRSLGCDYASRLPHQRCRDEIS
jgi:hypothetical protein